MTNKLFYGDNLDVLREHVADECVDLVYLNPPFNSKTGAEANLRARYLGGLKAARIV
jgi:16S rRNA G966 N2-methylase RsmD